MEQGSSPVFLRTEPSPVLPPPVFAGGPVKWMRENMLAGPGSAMFTLLGLLFVVWVTPGLVRYLFIDAVWSSPDGVACRAPGAGACWSFIARKLDFFLHASYPREMVWRVNLCLVTGAALAVWLLWPGLARKGLGAALFFLAYPAAALVLLHGSEALGLPTAPTDLWGGVFLSMIVATVGIVFSLPGGVLLALGRRSRLPVVRFFATLFIEFVRGVPFITVLFMANTMLPLFVPASWSPDRLLRPLVGVSIFASAYMAEIVRAGLQAVPKGQTEGAKALGLGYWRMMGLIILPQALTVVIPGIVGIFIGLFKDTTLVAVVGIPDFLRTVETARIDPAWAGPTISTTGYIFAGVFYWVFCFGMSRYSLMMERRLSAGRKR
jgi:general L-amino acid transport system permease protein